MWEFWDGLRNPRFQIRVEIIELGVMVMTFEKEREKTKLAILVVRIATRGKAC